MFTLNDRGPAAVAVAQEDAKPPVKWADFLRVDLTPRKYELVLLVFGLIVAVLKINTPLPFSIPLAMMFLVKSAQWTGMVLLLSLLVIGYRAIRSVRAHGFGYLSDTDALLRLIQPYWTLDFVVLTFRRCVAILGVIYFFVHLKHVILFIHKANYDLFFWDLDRWLHFGVQPNIFMMENLGSNHAFAVLADWLYFKYFTVKLIVSMIFLLEIKGRRLAEQYFLAYALLWSIGGLGYLVMPADGPCFSVLSGYSTPENDRVHIFKFPVVEDIPEDYARSYVTSKIWIAKIYQEKLWEHRKKFLFGEALPGMFYGIAAMPSLHVGAVMMITLFLFRVNPIIGVIGAVYTVMIFASSVFLQWHYAVDGYVGALMAVAVTRFSRSKLLWGKRDGEKPPVPAAAP